MFFSYKQQYPSRLPWRIKLSNGTTRTDPATFTADEILDAGYVAVANPPIVLPPNRLDWNGTEWIERAPNEKEVNLQKKYIQDECKRRLAETDYKTIKAIETETPLDPVYLRYRQDLRVLYNSIDGIDIWNVPWPTLSTPDLSETDESYY